MSVFFYRNRHRYPCGFLYILISLISLYVLMPILYTVAVLENLLDRRDRE